MPNQKIHQSGHYRLLELSALGTILPGMLIEAAPGGVQAHSTAGGIAERMFANEDSLQGGTVSGYYRNGAFQGYTVAGVDGVGPDPVRITAENPGNLVLALFKAGFNYTEGLKLISAGDGTLKPTTGTPLTTVGTVTAAGAVNLSASGAVNTLSQCRLI